MPFKEHFTSSSRKGEVGVSTALTRSRGDERPQATTAPGSHTMALAPGCLCLGCARVRNPDAADVLARPPLLATIQWASLAAGSGSLLAVLANYDGSDDAA